MFVVSVRERGKEEHKFTFRKPEIIVGRLRSNDIILPKRNISKRHAKLELTDDGTILLVDNGSTNGCYINGKKISERTAVGPEDKIFMGDYILQAQLLEEKSAVEEFTGETPLVGSDSPGQDRPTVADIDSAILDDQVHRIEVEQELGLEEDSFAGSSEETGLEMDVVEEEQGETMRFHDAAESTGGEVMFEIEDDELLESEALAEAELTSDPIAAEAVEEEEEIIDIAIEEDDEEEVTVDPVQYDPVPTPAPTPVPAASFAPSATGLSKGLTAALEDFYDTIAEQFDEWLEGDGDLSEATDKVGSFLIDALGDQVGDNLDELARQVTAELSYLGAVGDLLEMPQVGEVFVAPSGKISALDWAGNSIATEAALSCPSACARVATRILDAAGDAGEGTAEARLQDNTLARVFQIPFSADIPALRFIRPFQTTMSLGKLKDTGVMTAEQARTLEGALAKGRSFLICGRTPTTLGLIVHSLVGAVDSGERLLAAGDRFLGEAGLENATFFNATAVHSHEFAQACSQMGFDRLVLDNSAGDTVASAIEVAGLLQVPFIVSARLAEPTNVAALLGLTSAETRTAFLEALNAAGVVVVSVGAGKVDAVSLFTLQDGEPKLVDMSA